MKYRLKKDLPFAQKGNEVVLTGENSFGGKIYYVVTIMDNITLRQTDCKFRILEKDFDEWVEEVPEETQWDFRIGVRNNSTFFNPDYKFDPNYTNDPLLINRVVKVKVVKEEKNLSLKPREFQIFIDEHGNISSGIILNAKEITCGEKIKVREVID